jgi:hypothetical protein
MSRPRAAERTAPRSTSAMFSRINDISQELGGLDYLVPSSA